MLVTGSCACYSSPFLPLEARSDPGLLQKMRTVLRGLYGSKVSFLYLAAGIFEDPQPPVGIVQCYGVSAFAPTLEEACTQSLAQPGSPQSSHKWGLPPDPPAAADRPAG